MPEKNTVAHPRSLLEQLPEIVRKGKQQAGRIMEGLDGRNRVGLQTRELVMPAKDSAAKDFDFRPGGALGRGGSVLECGDPSPLSTRRPAASQNDGKGHATTNGGGTASAVKSGDRAPHPKTDAANWANRLIYGDNLLAMAALLAGDADTPSLRGGIDLIYIDPPFDSKADYRTKITLPGGDVEQKPTVIEQFAYSDTWADGTASYLAMIVPRLCLMRELLSERGSIYVHLDWHVGHYVKMAMDEIFGKDNFINEIIWHYSDKL